MKQVISAGSAVAEERVYEQARVSAQALLTQGWKGDGTAYNLGAYSGDVDALEARLDRPPTKVEREMLEKEIRRLLRVAHQDAPKKAGDELVTRLEAAHDVRVEVQHQKHTFAAVLAADGVAVTLYRNGRNIGGGRWDEGTILDGPILFHEVDASEDAYAKIGEALRAALRPS